MIPGMNLQIAYVNQTNSVYLAYVAMTCGGMYLAYGVFNIYIGSQSWIADRSTVAFIFLISIFHITLIIGAIITSLIYNFIDIFKIHVSVKSYFLFR